MSSIVSTAGPSALRQPARWVLATLTVAVLTACHPNNPPAPTAAAPVASPAAVASATPVVYTPPTADALYQMVAPIALYPDKLVALVLAGAIHPDEVSSAYNWLAQNPSVPADAVNQQPWDPGIKALTTFPNALNLLQSNLPWTTALGQAYNNDPADVLNAVQVMRQRAQQAGNLQSNSHLRVARATTATGYNPNTAANAVYSGPVIVPPPPDYITIEPVQAQTIYVPSYDPGAVYGAPLPYYEGYRYHPPVVSGVSPVAIGALAFGAGVVITAALDHHDWGWNAWGVHWGDGPRQAQWRPGDAPLPPVARPAVTYRQSTYVSHVSNVVNNRTTNNVYNNAVQAPVANTAAAAAGAPLPPAPGNHHAEAALAGAAVAGTALGAMALHHGSSQAQVPTQAGAPAAVHGPAARMAEPPVLHPDNRAEHRPFAPVAPVTTAATPAATAAAASAPMPHQQRGLNLPQDQSRFARTNPQGRSAFGTGMRAPDAPPPAMAQMPHPQPMAAPRPAPAPAPQIQAAAPPPRPVHANPPPPAPAPHTPPPPEHRAAPAAPPAAHAAPHEGPGRRKDERER